MAVTSPKAAVPRRSLHSVANDLRVDVGANPKLEEDLRDYANGRERLASGISNERAFSLETRASDGSLEPEDMSQLAELVRENQALRARLDGIERAALESKTPEPVKKGSVLDDMAPGLDDILRPSLE